MTIIDLDLYLDVQGVADALNWKRQSVITELSRGRVPEPDLVLLGKNLWLKETIEAWRKTFRPRRRKNAPRPMQLPEGTPAAARRGGAERPTRPQKIKGSTRRSRAQRPAVAAETPAPMVSTVSEIIARQVAAALRSEGFYATTVDVIELANADEVEDHDRRVLQQRVRAKLRGLEQREGKR